MCRPLGPIPAIITLLSWTSLVLHSLVWVLHGHFKLSGRRGMRKGLRGLRVAQVSLLWGWQPPTMVSG